MIVVRWVAAAEYKRDFFEGEGVGGAKGKKRSDVSRFGM